MPDNIHNLSTFQQEILKQEIEIIDKTISRIDQIQQSMKNWAITIWGGSLYLIVQYLDKSYIMILLTAIIPLLFGYIDVVWKRQILKVSYREKKISDFISGFSNERDFRILDPISISYSDSNFKKQTGFAKAMWYKADGLFYILMILVSVVFALLLAFK
jgi:hypothetical protein